MNKPKDTLKDDILSKILGALDEKQKTHDSILFGAPIETAGSGGALVQQTPGAGVGSLVQ